MTFGDRTEDRRAKVGTKVLAFGFTIFAVLGSFWTIVWFIRSYVEPPRVTIAPALALAAVDNKPVGRPAPAPSAGSTGSFSQPTPAVPPVLAEAAPAAPPPTKQAAPADQPNAANSIADRWMPMTPAPAPEPAPAPQQETTAA